jgi:NDP-sugar pyrophosphorylase family protein
MELPPVLVLAGGLGRRLSPLTDHLPKVLVPVLGKPFLDHLLSELVRRGAKRVVLALGHLARLVETHVGDGSACGLALSCVRELQPLGTGGAIRHALSLLDETFIVQNGDTLLEVDLEALVARHLEQAAPATLAVTHVPDRGRYGAVHVEDGRVVRFDEKQPDAGPGLINGGVCVMNRSLFDEAPSGAFSLERDLLPRQVGQIAAFETSGFFVDMGTHEALGELERSLAKYLEKY